jgi:hypothetical protein
MPLMCHVRALPAEGDGLDLLGYVEFQRNYRSMVVWWQHCFWTLLHLQVCSSYKRASRTDDASRTSRRIGISAKLLWSAAQHCVFLDDADIHYGCVVQGMCACAQASAHGSTAVLDQPAAGLCAVCGPAGERCSMMFALSATSGLQCCRCC